MNVYVLETFNENQRLLLQNTYDDTLEFIIMQRSITEHRVQLRSILEYI